MTGTSSCYLTHKQTNQNEKHGSQQSLKDPQQDDKEEHQGSDLPMRTIEKPNQTPSVRRKGTHAHPSNCHGTHVTPLSPPFPPRATDFENCTKCHGSCPAMYTHSCTGFDETLVFFPHHPGRVRTSPVQNGRRRVAGFLLQTHASALCPPLSPRRLLATRRNSSHSPISALPPPDMPLSFAPLVMASSLLEGSFKPGEESQLSTKEEENGEVEALYERWVWAIVPGGEGLWREGWGF